MSPFYKQSWFWHPVTSNKVVGLGGAVKPVILYTYQPLLTRFVDVTKVGKSIRATPEAKAAFRDREFKTVSCNVSTSGSTEVTWQDNSEPSKSAGKMYTEVCATDYYNANDDGSLGLSTSLEADNPDRHETLQRYPYIGTY